MLPIELVKSEISDFGDYIIVSLINYRDWYNMSRMLTLTTLAPDIVDSILDGTQSDRLNISVLKKGFPVDWGDQREWFGFS